MRKSVTIAPGLVMLIGDVAWDYLLQKPGDIIEKTRFVLDGTDGGGRSGYGHGADPLCETGFLHYGSDIGGEIVDTAETPGLNLDFVSIGRHYCNDE